MHLFQLREPRLKPLVPAMEGDLQGLHLLKQFLRIDFVNVLGLLCLSMYHLLGQDGQHEVLFLRVATHSLYWQVLHSSCLSSEWAFFDRYFRQFSALDDAGWSSSIRLAFFLWLLRSCLALS